MTKARITIVSLVAASVLCVLAASGGVRVVRADLDYNTHVTRYNPSCEKVLKRYMPNERRQHMSYAEYISMTGALKQCNAHATPGMMKQWAMAPMK